MLHEALGLITADQVGGFLQLDFEVFLRFREVRDHLFELVEVNVVAQVYGNRTRRTLNFEGLSDRRPSLLLIL